VLGVEAVGVGLVVVLLGEEFLVDLGVVDTVVPQGLVAIDSGIVVAGFLAEADQRVDVVGERDRSFAHLVAARILVEGEHGVGRFGGYVAGVEARERGAFEQTLGHVGVVGVAFLCIEAGGEIVDCVDLGSGYLGGIVAA